MRKIKFSETELRQLEEQIDNAAIALSMVRNAISLRLFGFGTNPKALPRTTTPTPSEVHLKALRDYATWRGAGWKDYLLQDWVRAGSRWPEARDRWGFLQQLRNTFGPAWLVDFQFCDTDRCHHQASPLHTCPQAVEMDHPEDLCICCPHCTQLCRDDI